MAIPIIDSRSVKDKSFLPDEISLGWITNKVSMLHLSWNIL
jgi:hypothetical protein